MLEFNGKPYGIKRNSVPKYFKTVHDRTLNRFSPDIVELYAAIDIEDSHPAGDYSTGWIYSIQVNIMQETKHGFISYLNLFRDFTRFSLWLVKLAKEYELQSSKKEMIFYVHNLSHETAWLIDDLNNVIGVKKALFTKPHKCIEIKLENGIKLRDSYVLTQKSLLKTCQDYRAIHGKVDGYDHDKVRYADTPLNVLEQKYIEADVLGLSESIYNYMLDHKLNLATIPLTATGLNRMAAKRALTGRGMSKNHGRAENVPFPDWANRIKKPITIEEYLALNAAYHGGHTAGNIFHYGEILHNIEHFDFASSYPAVMLLEKYPDNFIHLTKGFPTLEKLKSADFSWIATYEFYGITLKDGCTMPCIPQSKITKVENALYNNGKLLGARKITHSCTDPDFECIEMCYDWINIKIVDLWISQRDYLPNGLRDLIQKSYDDKSQLKGVEGKEVDYAIGKARLNSWYGMMVEQLLKADYAWKGDNIFHKCYLSAKEDTPPETLEEALFDYLPQMEKEFQKIVENRTTRYSWGVWVTAYAKRNLYRMMQCMKNGFQNVFYCDTDSVFGISDKEKIEAYNNSIKEKIKETGYGYSTNKNGKPCFIGLIDQEPNYKDFKYLHAKAYCGVLEDGKFEMTIAGVPKKKGCEYLEKCGGIMAMRDGFIFPASETGKLTAVYFDRGVNLAPADYVLSELGALPPLEWAFENDFELMEQWQEEEFDN